MRVAGPLPTLQLSATAAGTWQRTLQPGQVLHALVLSPATAGTALLRVGALELLARTELALTRDQTLLLEVVKGGEQPELRVLRAGADEALLERALRTSLPRQTSLAEQLGRILGAVRPLLADPAAGALAREVASLLDRAVATGTEPQALRRALVQSGLFFEARLAQGGFDAADLKGVLLRLLARLPTPAAPAASTTDGSDSGDGGRPAAAASAGLAATLRPLFEDALAGIRWQQISSLPSDTGQGATWHVALPLRAPDDAPSTLWLRAERDADGRATASGRWAIDLSLSVAPLGRLHAHLTLIDDRVSATLWAEQPDTADLITGRLDALGAGLERAGIAVGQLVARSGRPATAADQPVPPLRGLLDERA